jgi:hypothetical protein
MSDLFKPAGLDAAIADLEKDLLLPGGPRISTMRNHNFALFLYAPEEEFKLRRRIRDLVRRLTDAAGFSVLSIALHDVMLDRLRALDAGTRVQEWVAREKLLYRSDPQRALRYLKDEIAKHIEGPDGLSRDIAQRIARFRETSPADDKSLVLLGRAGALYPFFRSSALLKHLGDQTLNTPVVLLYPGVRREEAGLSFMKELTPDRDYRPRIYA